MESVKRPQVGEYWEFKFGNLHQIVKILELQSGLNQFTVEVVYSNTDNKHYIKSNNYWLPENMRRFLSAYNTPLWKVLND